MEALGIGPAAIVGTLLGLGISAAIRWLFPSLADATALYAVIVVIGFICGMVFDDKGKDK